MCRIKRIDKPSANRVKPTFLRDVKTEALLVFARTGLERYFAQIDEAGCRPLIGTAEDTAYVYDTLGSLLLNLQASVVDAAYVQTLASQASTDPHLFLQYRQEKPLIEYYNVLVDAVSHHYKNDPLYLPDFLVVCALSIWILEEEKSVHHYPFLQGIDWLELIGRFELNRQEFEKEGECLLSKIHDFSYQLIQRLKKKKLKIKPQKMKTKRAAA